jgi:hypothetical protein
MANEKIIFDTEVKVGNSVGSVKSLKAELKELRNSLGTLEQGSEAFNKAAQRAGQLQEKIRGVNDAIENADPEKKFAPFSRTIQGMAGGFAALQGAMGLFGSESEELEKTLLKVQSAMALSEGLNSLLEFKNDFKDLGTMIINNVVKAFTTLRGAIIATGIGALAVTVGVLVTNWKEFSEAITKAFPAFQVVTDFFKNFRQIAAGTLASVVKGFEVIGDTVGKLFTGDISGAIKSAKTFGEETAKAYSGAFAEEDRKISIENGLKKRKQDLDLLEAQGKDVKNARIKLMQDELSLLEKGSQNYNAKLIEIEKLRTEIRKEANDKKTKEDEDAKKKKEDEAKEDFEFYSNLSKEQYKKQAEIDKDAQILKNREQDKIASDIDAANKKQDEDDKKALEKHNATLKETSTNTRLSYDERLAAYKQMAAENLITATQLKDAEVAIEKEKQAAKTAALQEGANVLNQAADLLGKNTAEGKALAVASATISTYLSAQKAFESFASIPVVGVGLGIAAAGVAVAAGIANVNKILSTPVPGNNSGGGGGAVAAPSAPRIPQSFSGSMINQNKPLSTTTVGGQVQKVIVTETDITKTQDKVKGIIRKATIK